MKQLSKNSAEKETRRYQELFTETKSGLSWLPYFEPLCSDLPSTSVHRGGLTVRVSFCDCYPGTLRLASVRCTVLLNRATIPPFAPCCLPLGHKEALRSSLVLRIFNGIMLLNLICLKLFLLTGQVR